MGRYVRLAIDVDIVCIDRQAGSKIIFNTLDNLVVKFVVIDWGCKRMQIWHEHVDAIVWVISVFFRKVNHWCISTEKIADCRFFVGANTGKNSFHKISLKDIISDNSKNISQEKYCRLNAKWRD